MNAVVSIPAQRAHRTAAVGCALAIAGTVLGLFDWQRLPSTTLVPAAIATLLIDTSALGVLAWRRNRPSTTLGSALLLVSQVPFAVFAWSADAGRAAEGGYWVPYEANKMAALAIAMVAPPVLPIGLLAIALYSGSALLHHALLPASARAHMAVGEPWSTLGYTVIGLVIFVIRHRGRRAHDEVVRLRAEEALREKAAGVFVAVRDLANSPLQTLDVSVHLLATSADPNVVRASEWISRSVARLRRLNSLLDDAAVDALREDNDVSLDSAQRLEAWIESANEATARLGRRSVRPARPTPPSGSPVPRSR